MLHSRQLKIYILIKIKIINLVSTYIYALYIVILYTHNVNIHIPIIKDVIYILGLTSIK